MATPRVCSRASNSLCLRPVSYTHLDVYKRQLLRGSNLVGYASYPDNLVNAFIEESAKYGIDVFRVFDSLNWIPSMETAMEAVLRTGKILEATVCYTGDILDPKRDRYTLKYYVDFAKELERRGAHMIDVYKRQA